MSPLLRASAIALLSCSVAACGSDPNMNPDGARPDVTGDATMLPDVQGDGSNPPVDTGITPSDGGGGTCGGAYSPCDPVTNRGCMAGQMCVIANPMMRQSRCIDAGRGAFGAACTGVEDCQEGLGCIGGKCARWCCEGGDNATCRSMPGGRPGAICNINVGNSGLFACSLPDDCDVHQQNCPTMGDNCVPAGMDGTTQCFTPMMGAMPGQSCNFINDCPRGHLCVGPRGMSTCRPICDPTGMASGPFASCAMGMMCQGVSGLPRNVGVCSPMM